MNTSVTPTLKVARPPTVWTLEQRRALLQREILRYVRQGYRVVSQTDTAAQLVKPKRFSLLWFFILLGILYVPFYLFARDRQAYLEVDANGRIKTHK